VSVSVIPVRCRQLHGPAVDGADALDHTIEIGEHEAGVDGDLDLALLGHRHHSRRVSASSGPIHSADA